MKIADIELTTTAKEIDEIDSLIGTSGLLDLIEITQLSKIGNRLTKPQTSIAAGIIIGAELYHKRLADRGAAMMHEATGEELAVAEAFGVKERRIETLEQAVIKAGHARNDLLYDIRIRLVRCSNEMVELRQEVADSDLQEKISGIEQRIDATIESLSKDSSTAPTDAGDKDREVERLREATEQLASATEALLGELRNMGSMVDYDGKRNAVREALTATRTALNDGRGDGGEGE